MAGRRPNRNRAPVARRPFYERVWAALKSQWLATVLIIPLGFLGLQTYIAREDAREARVQSVNVDRIAKVQESGKAVDLALAAYIQSVSQLGLAERKLVMPGEYSVKPIQQARADVMRARGSAHTALANHGADVQALRGTIDESASRQYLAELAKVSAEIGRASDVTDNGASITTLGNLVVARNALVDQAMKRIG